MALVPKTLESGGCKVTNGNKKTQKTRADYGEMPMFNEFNRNVFLAPALNTVRKVELASETRVCKF